MSEKAPNKTNGAEQAQDGTLAELVTLAQEYNQDRKILRYALIVAVAFHVVLFIIHFPEMTRQARAEAKKERKIFVVQQPKFKPPEQKKVEILKPKTVKVPIPDPTPDEPEPVRQLDTSDEIPQVVPDDAIFGVPEAPPPPPEPQGPIRVGGQIKEPKRAFYVQPAYPEIARKARIEGAVILECVIDKEGNVKDIKVLKGLPMGLTEAAVDAVKQWRYVPSTLNNRPIEVLMTVTVTFRLQ
jgi:TonB family protein